jgi:hypothetical protein
LQRGHADAAVLTWLLQKGQFVRPGTVTPELGPGDVAADYPPS